MARMKCTKDGMIPFTPEEEAAADAREAQAAIEAVVEQEAKVRNDRNALLTASDWTQIDDAPVDATVWATYRQALRDITTHANFPNLDDADWPVKP